MYYSISPHNTHTQLIVYTIQFITGTNCINTGYRLALFCSRNTLHSPLDHLIFCTYRSYVTVYTLHYELVLNYSTCYIYSFCVADRLDVDHTVGLPNFDNLLTSFLLVFQVNTYTTANGNELLYIYCTCLL